MNSYGIKNVTDKELKFNYDKYYKEIALKLKTLKTEEDKSEIKRISREKMNSLLEVIEVNENVLKRNFIKLISDENSSKYLWILYSKYDGEENYLDKISDIFKRENEVVRGGTNTYKANGWMTHTLYVYQIANDNIAYNTEIVNFNGNKENKKQVQELHEIYNKLSKESKFLLKIFALIHDIGVVEEVKDHDKLGVKYVEEVLQEIGLNQTTLSENNILIDIKDFTRILKELMKNHTLITGLSSESSDIYIEKEYKKLLNEIPEISTIKKDISKVLMLLAYGDVIAVDESLMDVEKYQRTKECYYFFEQISQGKKVERDKERVAIERICDMIGEDNFQNFKSKFNEILSDQKINKEQFVENMYNIKLMRFTSPLMKTLNDSELSMKIYYELFELIGELEGKEELKKYTIVFIPDRHEKYFVEEFKNDNFFKCIEKMKKEKGNECTYGNIKILKGIDSEGKYLHIRVV